MMSGNVKPLITHEGLLSLVDYCPDTGYFSWRRAREHCSPGRRAGSLMPVGYVVLMIEGHKYYGHRLAWFYTHGVWPTGVMDHINHLKSDNRIANLRDVPQTINLQNRNCPVEGSGTGVLGASRVRSGRFRASIKVNKKVVHIGIFPTAQAAGDAYLKYKEAHHPGYVK